MSHSSLMYFIKIKELISYAATLFFIVIEMIPLIESRIAFCLLYFFNWGAGLNPLMDCKWLIFQALSNLWHFWSIQVFIYNIYITCFFKLHYICKLFYIWGI